MLDVRRLRLLRELAHRGTIAAVAEAVAFTPSAVSQQLTALEREAGVPLLVRTGRRVALTPAARNLVRHAEAVLAQLERASAELDGARRDLSGSLRIGTFPSAGRAMMPAALAELGRRHPGLEPMVVELDPALVPAALRAGDLDVALVHEYDFAPVPLEPGIAVIPLCREAMYLATTDAARTAVADCRDQPWILSVEGTLCHRMTLHACQAAGFTPHVRHHIDDFATVLALVAAGQGVALIPRLGLVDRPHGVTLTRLSIGRHTRIAHRSGAEHHPAVRAFADALRAAVPGDL
ncbi:LysR family transcriptional regulator [Kutzneria buriramensis]|uniref:DNA-binding transcriptional LysR family regulator n=1 Tax=Kutzneria buriramensis TaxID=1045776 RepID=A0A3E0HL73_9PSEU|nr:LysR family transcriptional regulator [Kutzneria buriramensis]REH47224.1 DNA-binding transcriptional LysR family regulator [Kutzneria buriramensis]